MGVSAYRAKQGAGCRHCVCTCAARTTLMAAVGCGPDDSFPALGRSVANILAAATLAFGRGDSSAGPSPGSQELEKPESVLWPLLCRRRRSPCRRRHRCAVAVAPIACLSVARHFRRGVLRGLFAFMVSRDERCRPGELRVPGGAGDEMGWWSRVYRTKCT